MTDAPLFLEREDEIAWLVLNRPQKMNAMTDAMWRLLPALAREADEDAGIKVIILKGVDGGAFCAGADIAEFKIDAAGAKALAAKREAVQTALNSIAATSKPTIAMVRGACMGGGCALAVACDFRFTDDSGRFAITPAKLGLAYGASETRRLMRLVGPSHARDILFTARTLDAAEAFRIGLVNKVFAAAELAAATSAFARSICALSQYSVRSIKKIIALIEDESHDDEAVSESLVGKAYEGEDHREGVDAFLARRRPGFTYR